MKTSELGCIYGFYLSVYVLIGSLSFQYSLKSIFGHNIPWYADIIAGLFFGWATIPISVVCLVIRLCGVEVPFIQ